MITITVVTPPIKRNRCKCRRCGSIIESIHVHDYEVCSCGSISTDGGTEYLNRGFQFDENDIIELSEYWSDALDSEVV